MRVQAVRFKDLKGRFYNPFNFWLGDEVARWHTYSPAKDSGPTCGYYHVRLAAKPKNEVRIE